MRPSAAAVACVLLAAAPVRAVRPETWEHKTEADFSGGKFQRTVVTSLGEVTLGRAAETLLAPQEKLGMVSALTVDGAGRVYLAAAPGATVYRLEEGKLTELAKLPGVLVRVLHAGKGRLLAGASGEQAGLYEVGTDGEVKPLWTDEEVKLVWAVVPGKGRSFYVATGPEGRVYHVAPGGKATIVYDGDDKNVLALARGPGGKLYAGTGENGLIVEIDPSTRKGRILYDAPEAEISRIVVASDGCVYAATSDSTKASADGEAPSDREKGAPAPATRPKAGAKPGAAATSPAGEKGQDEPELPPPPPGVSPARARELGSRPAKVLRELDRMEKELGKAAEPARPRAGPSAPPAKAKSKGNAVYRIDPAGFVRAVFRRPVAVLDMALHGQELVLATGHGGQVFGVDPDRDRTGMLVKLDPKDVTAIAGDGNGRLYLGTADQAAVYLLRQDLATRGTYLSAALDAKQIAAWGTLRVRASVPSGCSATIATRSGNIAKPDDDTWSEWSGETPVGRGWVPMASPAGRFLQYRLTLTGEGRVTAAIEQVGLVYQVRNLPPVVRGVEVTPSIPPDSKRRQGEAATERRLTYRMVKVDAADPNGDPLQYAVYFRRAGTETWIRLVKEFDKNVYPWNTTTVPDGVYEVRAEASDAPANPQGSAESAARVSRAVVVDNTPPKVAGLTARRTGKGKLTLRGAVTDAGSRIVQIQYAVDSIEQWREVLPADGICDSQKETFSAAVEDLEPGAHHVAVKAVDEYGNTGHAAIEASAGD